MKCHVTNYFSINYDYGVVEVDVPEKCLMEKFNR